MVAHTFDHKPITFYHPAVQCACMFLGEFLCIIPFLFQQWKVWSKKHAAAAANQGSQLLHAHNSSSTEPLLRSRQPSSLGMPAALSPGHFPVCRDSRFPEAASTTRTGEELSQSVFVLAVPTLCDATASLLLNVGLFYTSASIFQILRGLVVFFAGPPCPLYLLVLAIPTCYLIGIRLYTYLFTLRPHRAAELSCQVASIVSHNLSQ